jgi:hypothetical protein
VYPVPELLLLRKFGTANNRTRTYGCVARNSDHSTTEAVAYSDQNLEMIIHKNIVQIMAQSSVTIRLIKAPQMSYDLSRVCQ